MLTAKIVSWHTSCSRSIYSYTRTGKADVSAASHEECMSSLLQECRRSNLTFIASEGPDESIRLDRLWRVREPVSRSKSSVRGKVADVVHGRSRHAESQNELRAFQVLMATAHADSWQEQPFI